MKIWYKHKLYFIFYKNIFFVIFFLFRYIIMSVTSSYNGTNYIFALPSLEISGNFVINPAFTITDTAPTVTADVETETKIEISADEMKKYFQVHVASDDITDASNNDFLYRTRASDVSGGTGDDEIFAFNSGTTLAFGDAETKANDPGHLALTTAEQTSGITVAVDYLRYLAQKITGTKHGVDLFSNEANLENWDLSDNSGNTANLNVVKGFGKSFAAHNDWAAYSGDETGANAQSPAQSILLFMLKDASGVERVLDETKTEYVVDASKRPGTEIEDLSGALFNLPLESGDTLVAKVTIHFHGDSDQAVGTWQNDDGADANISRTISTRSYLIKFELID